MKGLFLKDVIALKKEFQTFVLVTLGVVLVAVLFLLSVKYGNMAVSIAEMQEASVEAETNTEITAKMIRDSLKMPILFALFIPMSFVLQSIETFRADEKAGFSKVVHSMPVSPYQVVGARYLMVAGYVGISLLAATISALVISMATSEWKFIDMFSSSMTFGMGILLYMGIAMFFIYVFSLKILERLQFGILILGLVGSVYWFQRKLQTMPEELMDAWIVEMSDNVFAFLQTGYVKLFFVAVVCFVISYLGSVKAFAGKKGA